MAREGEREQWGWQRERQSIGFLPAGVQGAQDSHGLLLVPLLLSASKGWAGEEDGGFEESTAHSGKLGVLGDLLCSPSVSLHLVLGVESVGNVRLVPED